MRTRTERGLRLRIEQVRGLDVEVRCRGSDLRLSSATSDAVPYCALAALCLVTLAALMRYKETAVPLTAER